MIVHSPVSRFMIFTAENRYSMPIMPKQTVYIHGIKVKYIILKNMISN